MFTRSMSHTPHMAEQSTLLNRSTSQTSARFKIAEIVKSFPETAATLLLAPNPATLFVPTL